MKDSRVGIVGLGTIGRQELDLWRRSSANIVGYDTAAAAVSRMRAIPDWGPETSVILTDDPAALGDRQVLVVCLPTADPSGETTTVPFDQFARSLEGIGFEHDPLVIVASTVPVGFSRSFAARIGRAVAHVPERFDPGRDVGLQQIPRVVAGIDDGARDKAADLYGRLGVTMTKVSSLEVAEASKILENAFRLVNVAFINEFAALADNLGISAAEVIEAAATKPFGFMAHSPGAGAGGTCIPVVPLFFRQLAIERGVPMPVLNASIKSNQDLAERFAARLSKTFNERSSVLVVGATYKPDYPDSRGSAALRIVRRLAKSFHTAVLDPYIDEADVPDGVPLYRQLPAGDESFDAVVVAVRHRAMDRTEFHRLGRVVIDLTRGETSVSGPTKRAHSLITEH